MTERRQFCPRGHDTFQTGRSPGNKKCLACLAEDAEARTALVEAAEAERHAEFERRQVKREREREREYQAAIRAGGDRAAEARWQRLWSETLQTTRYGLCQWALENGHPGACTNRTEDVLCAKHGRQADRESGQAKREEISA